MDAKTTVYYGFFEEEELSKNRNFINSKFSAFGKVVDIYIASNINVAYTFVTFENEQDARRAVEKVKEETDHENPTARCLLLPVSKQSEVSLSPHEQQAVEEFLKCKKLYLLKKFVEELNDSEVKTLNKQVKPIAQESATSSVTAAVAASTSATDNEDLKTNLANCKYQIYSNPEVLGEDIKKMIEVAIAGIKAQEQIVLKIQKDFSEILELFKNRDAMLHAVYNRDAE